MTTDNAKVNKPAYLFENLQDLLENQIESAKKNDLDNVEVLAEQAGLVIGKIVKIKAIKQAGFNQQREYLAKLYKRLELMLAARKNDLGKQLQQIGEARKTLNAYRSNI